MLSFDPLWLICCIFSSYQAVTELKIAETPNSSSSDNVVSEVSALQTGVTEPDSPEGKNKTQSQPSKEGDSLEQEGTAENITFESRDGPWPLEERSVVEETEEEVKMPKSQP